MTGYSTKKSLASWIATVGRLSEFSLFWTSVPSVGWEILSSLDFSINLRISEDTVWTSIGFYYKGVGFSSTWPSI